MKQANVPNIKFLKDNKIAQLIEEAFSPPSKIFSEKIDPMQLTFTSPEKTDIMDAKAQKPFFFQSQKQMENTTFKAQTTRQIKITHIQSQEIQSKSESIINQSANKTNQTQEQNEEKDITYKDAESEK